MRASIRGLTLQCVGALCLCYVIGAEPPSACVKWYTPEQPQYAVSGYNTHAWHDIDDFCAAKFFGFNMLQRGYGDVSSALWGDMGCAMTKYYHAIWMFRNQTGYFWRNRDGLEPEALSDLELSDMEPDTPASPADFGVVNITTRAWSLVNASYTFNGCYFCELLNRKELRLPVRGDASTNGVHYKWRYDVVVVPLVSSSEHQIRADLARVLDVPVESIVMVDKGEAMSTSPETPPSTPPDPSPTTTPDPSLSTTSGTTTIEIPDTTELTTEDGYYTDDYGNSSSSDTSTSSTTLVTSFPRGLEMKLIFYRVTLPENHDELPPTNEVAPTIRMKVVSMKNVGVCPAEEVDGFAWAETKPAHGVVKRNPGAPSVLTARECVLDGLHDADVRASWSNTSRWLEEWEECDDTIIGDTDEETLDNIADFLDGLTETPVLSRQLNQIADFVNEVLKLDADILAQKHNTTMKIIQDLEIVLRNLVMENGTEFVHAVRSNLSLLVADVAADDPVIGLSLTLVDGAALPNVTVIRSNESHALPDDVQVAAVMPRTLVAAHARLAFTAYPNGRLFIQNNTSNASVNSYVINIVLTDENGENATFADDDYVDVIFSPVETSDTKECAFWDFDENSWSTEGCVLTSPPDSSLDVCRCTHLTNFAEIITGGNNFNPAASQALDIISLVGCCLSLFALSLIALTAVCFKHWRRELSNKILLHMSAAVALNLIAFILVATIQAEENGEVCILLGVILHYSVLAVMLWMLVMSALQMLRLLTLLGNKLVPHLLLKVSLFAWGLPLLPVIILLCIDPHLYTQSETRAFCYPEGLAFLLTVSSPISFILLFNFTAFILIGSRLNSWCCYGDDLKLERHGLEDRTILLRRLRTLVVLFLLAGLTWVFGLFARDIVFAYLFCITATLQGVLLFVFLVLMERKTLGYWRVAVDKIIAVDRSSEDSQRNSFSNKTLTDNVSSKSS